MSAAILVPGCDSKPEARSNGAQAAAAQQPSLPAEPAPPPESTGGFDGARAFEHVRRLVAIGPRPPGSEGIRRAQEYIVATLQGYGCEVEAMDFHAATPLGRVPMKNIVARIPGQSRDVILLLTHYDTATWIPDFVGANDSGSSTGLMLEMARLLCGKKRPLTVWIAFLDGEEAFVKWTDTDSLYGSREMAARLALESELKRIRAVLLADMVGYRNLRFERDLNSTRWLTDLVWDVARRLGYGDIFTDAETYVEDDHLPFLRRGVPAVDVIQINDYPYWHTPQDTLDKISPRSLAITGHVFLESLAELEKRFR